MSITIRVRSGDFGLSGLVKEAESAVRPAAQAGAQVLYEQVKANVSRLGRKTGNLASSIYQAYSDSSSNQTAATYHVSWNPRKAPHGHLVEFGYLQRYEIARDKLGRMFPMVRPEMIGKPKPKSGASQAQKDAYYVPREGGPRHVAAKAFVRSAQSQMPRAQDAMRDRFFEILQSKGLIK